MAESISPERMQRLMELSNNAMTVELGALRNPQVTTVPSSEANAFYQSAPYAEREINKYLYEQYRNIEKAQEKFADGDLSKYRFEEAISDAEFEINRLKKFYENGLDQMGLDYLDQKQQEGISSLKDTVSTEFNPDFSMPELDQSRDQIVLGEKMSESVLAHEMGHAAFSAAKDFFRSKVVKLGSVEDALKATALEYGENIANKIYAGVRGNLDGFFADTDEATVQYYDNPLGDDPSNPGGGTPTSEGGPTYYSPGGGFDADTDNTFSFLEGDRENATDPLLQKPFTDYRTGELVYHDEYKGDFEGDLKKAGLMGFETLMSDLISERKGGDRFAERQRRGLKINPLGAPKGEVLRSVRPQTRPENFAQGGPVMRGIGTLNETARNMTRGPRGIGAYQQFASGGEAMGPPPTRGPDPQGIGYFQQFADGGPVYMQEGGDPFAEVDFDKLTAAVIQTESAGDPNAVSEDDAIGLMQVLPSTGAQPGYEQLGAQNVFDIAIDLGFPIDDSERTVEKARELLFNPKINVAFGTKYLRAMIAHSGGDIKQALQKYNAGTGNYQAFVEGRKPLDQEAVRYPVLVANALTGGNLAMPETEPFTPTPVQRGEDLIMSMPVAQSDAMSPLAIENRREGTEFQGQDAYSAGENLSRQTRQDFGSQAQQDDFEAMTPQNISMRERYSSPNMAAELVGGEEALKEGIGGLTRSLRPNLRPSEVEFGEDKGGVFRSLMPPRRPELEKEYPGNDTDALMRGLRGIRGRTLRKGFTPYVQDVRGELA